jgi:hypothetical protein
MRREFFLVNLQLTFYRFCYKEASEENCIFCELEEWWMRWRVFE